MGEGLLFGEFLAFDSEEGNEMDQQVHFEDSPASHGELRDSLGVAAAWMQLRALFVLGDASEGLRHELFAQHLIQLHFVGDYPNIKHCLHRLIKIQLLALFPNSSGRRDFLFGFCCI
jgi:hypothetical protein